MKLYYNTALKKLEEKENILVWFFPWNGIVRSNDGETVGEVSARVMDRLQDNRRLIPIGRGNGLLDHERYFKLKKERP